MNFLKSLKSFVFGKGAEELQSQHPETTSSAASSKCDTSKAARPEPVLQDAGYSAPGGIQGLSWYASNLKHDKEGDIADEFFEETVDHSGKAIVTRNTGCGAPACKVHSVEEGNVIVKPT